MTIFSLTSYIHAQKIKQTWIAYHVEAARDMDLDKFQKNGLHEKKITYCASKRKRNLGCTAKQLAT